MSLNIILVTRSFHPVIAPRSFRGTELACELARQGHRVTVYFQVGEHDYSAFAAEHGLTIRDLGPLQFKPIRAVGSEPALKVRRAVRLGARLLLEYPDVELVRCVDRALRSEQGYDLAISLAVPYPIHWGVAKALGRNPGLAHTWVADCGDPYMGNRMNKFRKPFYFKYVEQWFCRRADYLTVPIEEAKAGYYPEFHNKIRVIPQGFRFDGAVKSEDARILNPVPTFAYAGAFMRGQRDPGPFLEYLASKSTPFRFICYTQSEGLVRPFLERLGDRLELRDYVPREQLLQELGAMDFLVNFENGTSVQSPSKLIDYALTGRPIISVEPLDIDREAIDSFLAGDYRSRYFVPDLERYDIRNVAAQFLALARKGDEVPA